MVKTKPARLNWLLMAGCVIGSVLVGSIGSIFTTPNISTWYKNLVKPPFNPPNWIFAPVWTVLFGLIGAALYFALASKEKNKKLALIIFTLQFFFNILWSILFFGMRSPFYGLVCIYLLWLLIMTNIIAFARISETAGWLLIPYLFWVNFASYLNLGIYLLN